MSEWLVGNLGTNNKSFQGAVIVIQYSELLHRQMKAAAEMAIKSTRTQVESHSCRAKCELIKQYRSTYTDVMFNHTAQFL